MSPPAPLGLLTHAACERALAAFAQTDGDLASGVSALDDLLSPMHPGSLTVVASRRGGGRTTLALQLALGAASSMYLSTGLRPEEVAHRVLTMESGVPGDRLRHGRLSVRDWRCVASAIDRIDQRPGLWIADGTANVAHVHEALGLAAVPPRTVVVDGIDLDGHFGFESRSDALRALDTIRHRHTAAWIVTVGLSCADYEPAHGTAFDAFLDTVPTSVDRVVWLDADRSSSARRVHVFDRNGPGGSIDLVRSCGVPRFYAATRLADTRGDSGEPPPGYTVEDDSVAGRRAIYQGRRWCCRSRRS